MAKEIKTLNVTTNNEARTIRAFQSFGWTLLNNQEVYVKDSHLDSGYSITETIHYVKLTFERDGSKLKYYPQLRQLEDAFYAIPEPKKPRKLNTSMFIFAYVLFGLMAVIMLLTPSPEMVLIPAIAIGAFALWHRNYNAKLKAWQAAYDKCWNKRERILAKTEPYLE